MEIYALSSFAWLYICFKPSYVSNCTSLHTCQTFETHVNTASAYASIPLSGISWPDYGLWHGIVHRFQTLTNIVKGSNSKTFPNPCKSTSHIQDDHRLETCRFQGCANSVKMNPLTFVPKGLKHVEISIKTRYEILVGGYGHLVRNFAVCACISNPLKTRTIFQYGHRFIGIASSWKGKLITVKILIWLSNLSRGSSWASPGCINSDYWV